MHINCIIMNRKLKLLPLLVLLAWAGRSQAQTTDSLARHGFHQGANGFNHSDGWAQRGEGRGQRRDFGRGQRGFHRGQRGFRRHDGHGGFGHEGFAHFTPEQRKQLMAINKDYRQKREDLYKQDNITLKQYKAGLIALDKDKKAKTQALITPQQKTEMAMRRNRMEENRQVMAAARLERLRLDLQLTDDQVAQIKTGQQNLRNQAQAIHENDNLLPQEKREQMKTLMTTRNDNMKMILTPDQYTKFQQKSHHRGGFGGPGGQWQGRGSFGGRTT
jgi:ribosomal protein L15